MFLDNFFEIFEIIDSCHGPTPYTTIHDTWYSPYAAKPETERWPERTMRVVSIARPQFLVANSLGSNVLIYNEKELSPRKGSRW